MRNRLSWDYSEQVLEELGFIEPDVEEDLYSLLYQLAGDPTDESQLIQPVPGYPDLMTVTFGGCLLMYHVGPRLTALLLRQLPGGTFDAGSGAPAPSTPL